MKLKTFKVRAEFALTSTSIDGIDLIKDALLTAKK
jgi:translation initiation factor 2 alpha subunit (eIF-2alpha)